jgi:hypothetical protein
LVLVIIIFEYRRLYCKPKIKADAEHEAFLKGFDIYGNNWYMISTIVTTRTSTQIRTHAQKYHASLSPDSRARMLENNAEAQQKHKESLSPDMKACIQESNTAAHQKRRQSLSLDTKACIQESNTAAHQKHQEFLSLDTKACIQERNTTAHQK